MTEESRGLIAEDMLGGASYRPRDGNQRRHKDHATETNHDENASSAAESPPRKNYLKRHPATAKPQRPQYGRHQRTAVAVTNRDASATDRMDVVASKTTDSLDTTCSICREDEKIYAIAPCNHPICYKCSIRLRFLLQQFYCPICRTDCPTVLYVRTIHNYLFYPQRDFILGNRPKALYEDRSIELAVNNLTAHHCTVCAKENTLITFKSFKQLQEHVRKNHQLYFCDICTENVKLFSSERKAYNRPDLAVHKRKGDPDDTSFKGHPLCQICDNRFLDTDELWRHLRKDHYFCHFCDADGRHIYFGTYDDVKVHFGEEHYLCEEDECARIQFTNAFRDEVDLKAHKTQYHLKGVKRSQQRQTRTLDIEFNYGDARRSYARDNRKKPNREGNVTAEEFGEATSDANKKQANANVQKSTREDVDIARAVAASLQEIDSAPQTSVDVESAQDFPSLGGDGGAKPAASSPAPVKRSAARRVGGIVMYDDNEEFPNLLAASAPPPLQPEPVKPAPPVVKPKVNTVAPAALKAKSNPWSNTEDEFPTLEGSKAKPLVHGWHLPKPQPRPKMTFINNSRKPKLNSASDFPTLGMGPPSSNLASIGSWIHKNGKNGKSVAAAPEVARQHQTASAPHINHYIGAPISNGLSSANGEKKSKKKNSPPSSAAETSKSDDKSTVSEASKKVTKTHKKAEKKLKSENENTEVASTGDKKRSKDKQEGSSKQKTTQIDSKVNTESKSNSSSDCQKSKSKKKPIENGKEPDSVKEQTSSDTQIGISNGKSSEVKAVISSPQLTVKSEKSTSKPPKSSKKMAALEAELDNDEFPSLSTSSNAVKGVREQSKFSIASASDDYPSLTTAVAPQPRKPPPGLGRSAPPGLAMPTAPPPGFGVAKPPGLEMSKPPLDINSLASLIIQDNSSQTKTDIYVEPINFAQRNKKLSFKLRELIYNDMDKFHKFKNFSVDFRTDCISADEFYKGCTKLLSQHVLLEILPELLVLLPDLGKQQALYKLCGAALASTQAARSWSSTSETELVQCTLCGQVLLHADISYHNAHHGEGLDDFPVLSNVKAGPSATRLAW